MQLRTVYLWALLSVSMVIAQQGPEPPEPHSSDQTNANEAPPPPVYTIIEGQVVDELGRGIRDAVVKVAKIGDQSIQGEAGSDHYGDFRIKLAGEHPGKFKVTFEKETFVSQEMEIEIFEDDLEPFVDTMLSGALTIAGEVVEFLENQPVVGARVRLEAEYRNAVTLTDEAGRFEFKNLLSGHAVLIVSADGFGKSKKRVMITPDGELVRIVLTPEQILRLAVIDDQNHPIAQASVEIEIESTGDYRSLTTDSAGQVTVKQLPYEATIAKVRLIHRDYVATGRFDREVLLSEDELKTRATLRMMPAARIKGRVIEAASNVPLNGARVDVGATLAYFNPHTFTNLSGEFMIGSLQPGKTVVTAQVAGFAPQLKEVSTSPHQTTTVDFALDQGRTITGVVLDQQDKPVKHADVEAMRWHGYHTLGLSARTDEQGRFSIEHTPTDEFSVNIIVRGYARLIDQRISAGRNDYEFKLEGSAMPDGSAGFKITEAKVGDDCPPFKLTTLDGKQLDNNSIKGKLTLLDFWATWCGPCVNDIPILKRIQGTFGKRDDFVLISISSDFDKFKLQEFLRANELSWPQVFAPGSGGDELSNALGIRAIPCTIIIGPDEKIISIGLIGELLFNKISELLPAK